MPTQPFVNTAALKWEATEPGVERQVLAYDASLMMVRVRFAAGATGALHSHPHRQISYVSAGVFEVHVGKERRVLRAGDSFVVEPNVLHGVVARQAGLLVDVFSPAREEFLSG